MLLFWLKSIVTSFKITITSISIRVIQCFIYKNVLDLIFFSVHEIERIKIYQFCYSRRLSVLPKNTNTTANNVYICYELRASEACLEQCEGREAGDELSPCLRFQQVHPCAIKLFLTKLYFKIGR